jgi:hypothetical protein
MVCLYCHTRTRRGHRLVLILDGHRDGLDISILAAPVGAPQGSAAWSRIRINFLSHAVCRYDAMVAACIRPAKLG